MNKIQINLFKTLFEETINILQDKDMKKSREQLRVVIERCLGAILDICEED